MRRLAYDIFKKPAKKTFVWVQAVRDLDTANARVRHLRSTVGGEYVVFDRQTLKIVTADKRAEKATHKTRDAAHFSC